jgi:hypothetical protein
MPGRWSAVAEKLHATCIETTNIRAGDQERTWLCGPDCPPEGAYATLAGLRATDDPERDRRRELYADRERRRTARALDRYLEDYYLSVAPATDRSVAAAGERFVEAVGDYVLARLGDDVWTSAHRAGLHADMWVEKCALCLPGDDPRQSHHNRHYDATGRCDIGERDPNLGCPGKSVCDRSSYACRAKPHNADDGASDLCEHGFIADGQACGEFGCTEPQHKSAHGATDKLHAHGCRGAFGVPCAEWCDGARSSKRDSGRLFGADAHGGYPDGRESEPFEGCNWPAEQCSGHYAIRSLPLQPPE